MTTCQCVSLFLPVCSTAHLHVESLWTVFLTSNWHVNEGNKVSYLGISGSQSSHQVVGPLLLPLLHAAVLHHNPSSSKSAIVC